MIDDGKRKKKKLKIASEMEKKWFTTKTTMAKMESDLKKKRKKTKKFYD